MSYMKLVSNVSTEWRSLRAQTNYPTVPHILGASGESSRLLAGNHAKAALDAFYVYSSDVIVNGALQARANDKWWLVYEANGTAIPSTTPKWIAEIHKGQRYLNATQVDDDDPPPPPPPAKTVTGIVIDNPAKVTISYSDGSVQTFP